MTDPIRVFFIVQLLLVSTFLLRALVRARATVAARRLEPEDGVGTIRSGTVGRAVRGRGPSGAATDGAGSGACADAALASLEAERSRLEREVARLRDGHALEEASFRERRREAMLALHEHRRLANELAAAEPVLSERVDGLRSEVAHLELRRDALRDEVAASSRTSVALHERLSQARRELEHLRQDKDRLRRRLLSDGQRLQDLARRRSVLRAETDELTAVLELLQQLAEQPHTLVSLSDGELRQDAPAMRIRPVGIRAEAAPLIDASDADRMGVARAG